MAMLATAAPLVTDLKQADELLVLCSSLGMRNKHEDSPSVYHMGDECREVIQDLTRLLRREDKHSKHSYLRQLGVIQVFQKDLVPLLIEYAGKPNVNPDSRESKDLLKMLFALLKLMLALTMPAMLVFDGATEKIETTREFCQVVDFLQQYKSAMIETWDMIPTELDIEQGITGPFSTPAALGALLKILAGPISAAKRTSRQDDIVELVLLLFRNVMHCPNPIEEPNRRSLQDRAVLAFEAVGIFDLISMLANDMDSNDIFVGLLVEIVVYALQGQSPEGLLDADEDIHASNTQERRKKQEAELRELVAREQKISRSKRAFQSNRHSRFTGFYTVAPEKENPGGSTGKFYPHPLMSLKDPNRAYADNGKNRRKKTIASNPHLDTVDNHGSDKAVRKALRKFTTSFLEDAYNLVMPKLHESIEKAAGSNEQVMHTDEVHYCQMLEFFMGFHRKKSDITRRKAKADKQEVPMLDVAIVASTIRLQDVHYIKKLMMKYFNLYREDNAGAVLWSQRLHHAVRAMHELLVYLERLNRSPDEEHREFASSVMADLFYEAEFIELLPKLAKGYNPAKQTPGFARDVILFNHLVLNLLKVLQQSSSFKLFMARKSKKRSKKSAQTEDRQDAKSDSKPVDAAVGNSHVVGTDVDSLFKDDGDARPEEDSAQQRGTEFEFDLDQFEEKFADAKLIKTYCSVLKGYRSNLREVNHAIIKMFHRVYAPEKQDARWIFYQLSVFMLFQTILNDPATKHDKKFSEVRGFVKTVVGNFFEDVEKRPPLFVEILFWKHADDVREIALGPSKADHYKRKKSFKWTPKAEDKLRELYIAHHEDEDAITVITEKLQDAIEECAERSEASVASKLRNMRLPLEPASRWTNAELGELRELYESYVHAGDPNPLQTIVDDRLFSDKKNTVGKLRNQLKKMGIDVISKNKSTAWTEDDIDALRELHSEYKDLFTTLSDIVDAVLDDARLVGKTSASVKAQLRELGLIKSRQKKAKDHNVDSGKSSSPVRRSEQEEAPRRGGELDLDFVQSLKAAATRTRELGAEAEAQLKWLIHEMDECADSYDLNRRNGAHIGKTLRPEGNTECIRSIVGMLGFIRQADSDSSSDSDSDDEVSKKMIWEINASVPGSRLRDMISVLDLASSSHGSESEHEDELMELPKPAEELSKADEEKIALEARKRAMEALSAKRSAPKQGRPTRPDVNPSVLAAAVGTTQSSSEQKKTQGRQRRRIALSLDTDSSSDSEGEERPLTGKEPKSSTAGFVGVIDSEDSEDEAPSARLPTKGTKRVLLDSDDSNDEDDSEDGRPMEVSPKKARADDGLNGLSIPPESADVGQWAGEQETEEEAVPPKPNMPAIEESEDVGAWAGGATQITNTGNEFRRDLSDPVESKDVGEWATEQRASESESPSKRRRIDTEDSDENPDVESHSA